MDAERVIASDVAMVENESRPERKMSDWVQREGREAGKVVLRIGKTNCVTRIEVDDGLIQSTDVENRVVVGWREDCTNGRR